MWYLDLVINGKQLLNSGLKNPMEGILHLNQ